MRDSLRIPSAPLAEIIEGWAMDRADDFMEHGFVKEIGSKILAKESGISARTIHRIRTGEHKQVEFNTADKLLCAMELVHEWRGRLAPYYGPIPPAKAEAHRCSKTERKTWRTFLMRQAGRREIQPAWRVAYNKRRRETRARENAAKLAA